MVFALAVHSFTRRWPVDAWAAVRDDQRRIRKLFWLHGNTVGQLVGEGDENSLQITGSVQPLSAIRGIRIAAEVSLNDFSVGYGRRAITVPVDAGRTSP